jgi:hypothetical protein
VRRLAPTRSASRALTLLVALCAAWTSGCEGEAFTEIVLVVDTNGPTTAIDTLEVVVRGPSGEERRATVPYEGSPRSIGLVPGTDVLGPVDLVVIGSLSAEPDVPLVTRTVSTRFERGVRRVLHLRLAIECIGVICADVEQTCGPDGACIATEVDPTRLPSFDGAVSVPEQCNGVDDDADGRADEDFDLDRDPRHCGACNAACAGGLRCLEGACEESPLVQVAAGATHTCARRESGGVACWGSNLYGELGDGTRATRYAPVTVLGLEDAVSLSAGFGFTCAVRRDRTVVCWGSNACGELGRSGTDSGRPVAVPGVTDALEVSGGNCHNCARRTTGDVVCWGTNDQGQLGSGTLSGTTPLRATPVVELASAVAVRAGAGHTCALRDNGAVNCWGANDAQQVGDGTTTARPSPTAIVNLDDLTDPRVRGLAVAAGADFSCALTALGVRCWGASESGRIGLPEGEVWGGVAPTTVAGTAGATSVSIGALGCFGCALGAGGVVSCWGCNASQQIAGLGEAASPSARRIDALPPATAVSVGSEHACALGADGAVRCWGANESGQLGLGSDIPTAPPAQVVGL